VACDKTLIESACIQRSCVRNLVPPPANSLVHLQACTLRCTVAMHTSLDHHCERKKTLCCSCLYSLPLPLPLPLPLLFKEEESCLLCFFFPLIFLRLFSFIWFFSFLLDFLFLFKLSSASPSSSVHPFLLRTLSHLPSCSPSPVHLEVPSCQVFTCCAAFGTCWCLPVTCGELMLQAARLMASGA
jgi:hypothetical protein